MKLKSMRAYLILFIALLVVLGAAAPQPAAAASMAEGGKGGRPFKISMTGAEEAPGPGDPDGSGVARILLNQGQGRVCWKLSVTGIAPATGAHIHRAPAGEPGPVVVPLTPPTDGFSMGCADVAAELIKEIRQNPAAFYVNVHNAEYPGGAVRGQLGK